ncbi:helicase-exonuclease AddAB subunit AddB [Geosporobacter ferrireducens]|uniref:ATP-dependent helicase/deoxyribonuclease subunit B n=1 Tax=Geosporobacter ferrireducens TaxID=1424294 RepID=A0A1D8GL92_9FIRM|nr:helicase-exonuclease AddAB subunit AddB [Geosporobacter ferrireducens]AOT71673.1 helicase-exonuclease AddAB subunit AddB [Geosporobacter ferrireducens]MTI55444.1 helicase-exonuclease AddAB subunit AddB [Geosporobacter ferrireducens]
MKIKYILGRAGCGKSHYILEDIKKALGETREALILIVPDQFTLQAERDLIEKMKLPGIMHIQVLSFTRLAQLVFNEVGGTTRIHINDQGKQMIIRKIIDESEKELRVYKKAAQQEGFISKFSELLCELKQQTILPQELMQEAFAMGEDSILRDKLSDIAYIYEQFNRYLEGKYLDTEDYISLLIEKLEAASFLRNSRIWIDGFHSFTVQTYQIIEKLMGIAQEVTVALTMPPKADERDGDLFKISEQTYQKLHDLAVERGVVEEKICLESLSSNGRKKPAEMVHIEAELYAYPYSCYEAGKVEQIKLFAGNNLHTEVENATAQILSLVRDQGYRWRDIALVSNDMENYGLLVERVFQEYGIPYFLDQKKSIMNNSIIECILSALEIIRRGFRYEDVFRFFKAGFSGLSIEAYEQLENYVLRYGIQGSRWMEEFTKGDEGPLKALNESRVKFIQPIKILEKKIKGKKTVEGITKGLYEYLVDLGVDKQLEDWIDTLRAKGAYAYVLENAQLWNILMDTLDQMVEIIGEQSITLKEYIRILDAGFSSLELAIIPTTIDQVLVGNIQRSKSHDIKALFVVGVNDGILPTGKGEEGILSDEEKRYIKEKGLQLRSDHEGKACEEKFLIYSAFSKPGIYLWISYALADQEGKALRPSILIDRIKKLFKGLSVESDIVYDEAKQVQLIGTQNSTFKYLIENLRKYVDGKPMADLWWDVYCWYYEQEEWKFRREAVIDGFFHSNQESYLESQQAKQLYRLPIRSSVSRLEQFVNCPFAHFIKYGLKPKERLTYKVQAPDIGELFHDSMKKFTEKLQEEDISWRELDRKQSDVVIDSIIDEMVPAYGEGVLLSTHRYKYLVQRLKRISRRAVWTLTEHLKRGSFEPIGHEIGFGQGEVYPPIEVELPDGEKIYLEGRIDRVDVYEDEAGSYMKIIDYKSGSKDFDLSEVYYGMQLQLMIYLDAMLTHHKHPENKPVKPAGIFYFKIDDPMIKADERIVEAIEKEIRKKLKLKGLVLKDVHIIRQMDREIEGYSDIIPVSLGKNQDFHKWSSVLSHEGFHAVLKHVRNLVKEITNEMIKGNIRIEPCKNGRHTACSFCSYQGICQFDSLLEDNRYKHIKKMKDEQVMNLLMLEEEVGEDGSMDGEPAAGN